MKNTDRFLIGIVTGVILLVVFSFVISLRQPQPDYQPEETPEGVVQNYLLALKRADYERAYGYLSPELLGYPADVAAFTADVSNDRWAFRLDTDVTIDLSSATVTDDRAVVSIRETRFDRSGLFGEQNIDSFTVTLQQMKNTWFIANSGAYWRWCWNNEKGCPGSVR
jgi:hypothetical protein